MEIKNIMGAQDVWTMVSLLQKIDIVGLIDSMTEDDKKVFSYQPPMKMNGGKMVPKTLKEYTEGERRALDKYNINQYSFAMKAIGILVQNIDNCKDDVNKILASACGVKPEEVANMQDGVEYIRLLRDFLTRETTRDFFSEAWSLLSGMTPNLANAFGGMATQDESSK